MIKTRKHAWEDCVYNYPDHCGFGDAWALTSYLLRISEELKTSAKFFSVSKELLDRVRLIMPFLETTGTIQIVDKPPQRVFNYCEPFLVKFKPTHKTWHYNNNKIAAYQFDGNHLWEEKNLPSERLNFIINSLVKIGYQTIDVGHDKPLSFIIDTLSKCSFFVGCPSGLSVVCISVGTPIHLITRQMNPNFVGFLQNCQYYTTSVQFYRTVNEFLLFARRHNQFIGL